MNASTNWNADYSINPGLSGACSKVTIVERATNELGSAEHVFSTRDAQYMGLDFKDIAKLFIEQADKPFQFKLLNRAKESKTWNHVVVRSRLIYSPNDKYDPKLILTTVDQLALTNRFIKSRAHRSHFGRMDQLVSSIIQENDLPIESVAPTEANPEFYLLHQPYQTDYQFLIGSCVPRSSGPSSGYRLFTKDGKRVCFQPLDYKAVDCKLPLEVILKIEEIVDSYATMRSGGRGLESSSLNPYSKVINSAKSVGEDGETGTFAAWEYPAYHVYPITSSLGLEAVTTAHQRSLSGLSHPLIIKIQGEDLIGNERVAPEFPLKVSIEPGSRYRSTDAHTGYAEEIIHAYESGSYTMTLKCLRGKINP